MKYIEKEEWNHNKLRNNLCQFKNISQYVYSCVYPEVYCSTERRGFDLTSSFQLVFKTYKDKKRLNKLKKIKKYQVEWRESFENEQKPIEIDIFNNEEEKIVKERVEKRKKSNKKLPRKIRP